MIWKRLNDHGKNWRHVYKVCIFVQVVQYLSSTWKVPGKYIEQPAQALVLLEYLIKTGSEKVAQQCKENIFAIQTLKDFQVLSVTSSGFVLNFIFILEILQFVEENKDQGLNVREKAKAMVSLLKVIQIKRYKSIRYLNLTLVCRMTNGWRMSELGLWKLKRGLPRALQVGFYFMYNGSLTFYWSQNKSLHYFIQCSTLFMYEAP